MESIISDMVQRFESGSLSRRNLVKGLSMLLLAAGGVPARGAESETLHPKNVHHVSILVSDLERSVRLYGELFGMTPLSEDKENRISRLGVDGRVLLSLREEPPAGTIDHIAFGIDNFEEERVRRILADHGLTLERNIEYGWYFLDPDGAVVQLV